MTTTPAFLCLKLLFEIFGYVPACGPRQGPVTTPPRFCTLCCDHTVNGVPYVRIDLFARNGKTEDIPRAESNGTLTIRAWKGSADPPVSTNKQNLSIKSTQLTFNLLFHSFSLLPRQMYLHL